MGEAAKASPLGSERPIRKKGKRKMEMLMTKRMFRVFDDMYHRLEDAEKVLKGWEHKEKIKEFHVVGFPSIISQDIVSCHEVMIFNTLDQAIEEING
jgi:hypothetical protein